MIKYYTRACNFYYGKQSRALIKKKKTLPLCGNKNISFDSLEIFTRNNKKINSRYIKLYEIKKLKKEQRIKINQDIKKICTKKKFFKECKFFSTFNNGNS